MQTIAVGTPAVPLCWTRSTMASALAAQLQQLAKQQGQPVTAAKPRGKPSLLFDSQRAADVDLQSIYELGCQGAAERRLQPEARA